MNNFPKSKIEAVNQLLISLSAEELKELKWILDRNGAIRLHHTLGRDIRNNFGLWRGNQDLLNDCGKTHPDDASHEILEALHKKLKENNV